MWGGERGIEVKFAVIPAYTFLTHYLHSVNYPDDIILPIEAYCPIIRIVYCVENTQYGI